MSWINKHKRVWRVAVLVLLLVAVAGPWSLDRINVPSKYPCSPPFIRLEGDFCGEPMSGIHFFSWMVGGYITMVVGLVTGATVLPDRAREFVGVSLFVMLLFLLTLPFFTTLLVIWRRDSRRLRVFHLIVWGLAAVLSLLLAVSGFSGLYWVLWGIWLYIGLTAGALMLEVLALVAGRRPSQG